MRKTLMLMAAAGALALAFPAIGQDDGAAMDDMPGMTGPGGGMMMGMGGGMKGGMGPFMDFDAMDADGNGTVTPEEMRAFRQANVSGVDADGNGLISEAELVAHMTARMQQRVAAMAAERIAAQDLDGDGQLSAEELLAPPMPARMMARVDADGDGAISREEFDAAQARMAERMDERGRRGGRGHGFGWWDRND